MSEEWVDPDVDRKFRTVVPPALWQSYYYSLGRLAHAFASAENNLKAILNFYIRKQTSPVGSAFTNEDRSPTSQSQKSYDFDAKKVNIIQYLLGGSSRFAALKRDMIAIIDIAKEPDPTRLEVKKILDHFGEIQFIRDRIFHNGASPDMTNKDGWFFTTNMITVNSMDKTQRVYFTPKMLCDMQRDLDVGVDRISIALDNFGVNSSLENDPERVEFKNRPETKAYEKDKLGPWRFDPRSLKKI